MSRAMTGWDVFWLFALFQVVFGVFLLRLAFVLSVLMLKVVDWWAGRKATTP